MDYRTPIVADARRIAPGHRVQRVVTSDDRGSNGPSVLGFTHNPVRDSRRNTLRSFSRLRLPVQPAAQP